MYWKMNSLVIESVPSVFTFELRLRTFGDRPQARAIDVKKSRSFIALQSGPSIYITGKLLRNYSARGYGDYSAPTAGLPGPSPTGQPACPYMFVTNLQSPSEPSVPFRALRAAQSPQSQSSSEPSEPLEPFTALHGPSEAFAAVCRALQRLSGSETAYVRNARPP
mgnify:CR=1 FL=1